MQINKNSENKTTEACCAAPRVLFQSYLEFVMERFSARRRHCCSRPVRGVRGRFVWRIRKHELTRRSVQWGKISVHVSGRDRESRSREVSARFRMREKFVAGMWSREFCHVQHVGTRHICHSDHMYWSPLQQSTTLQLAAYCVHCFLRPVSYTHLTLPTKA